MQVKISRYPRWVGPYQIADKIIFWANKCDDHSPWSERQHALGRWLAKDRHGNDSWLAKICAWIHKHWQNGGDRRVSVRIDPTDVYSADHTLALIIAPMLRMLRTKKNGSPQVDSVDLPPELQMSERDTKIFNDSHWDQILQCTDAEKSEIDKKYHAGWDWVLDEMIWAFEQHADPHYNDQFHSGTHDITWTAVDVNGQPVTEDYQGVKYHRMDTGPNDTHVYDAAAADAWQVRMANGRRLFAKYYQSLWW